MQADGQLCDLAYSLLLLGHGGPDVLLKLLVEHAHRLLGLALRRILPYADNGGTRFVAPELVLKNINIQAMFFNLCF